MCWTREEVLGRVISPLAAYMPFVSDDTEAKVRPTQRTTCIRLSTSRCLLPRQYFSTDANTHLILVVVDQTAFDPSEVAVSRGRCMISFRSGWLESLSSCTEASAHFTMRSRYGAIDVLTGPCPSRFRYVEYPAPTIATLRSLIKMQVEVLSAALAVYRSVTLVKCSADTSIHVPCRRCSHSMISW